MKKSFITGAIATIAATNLVFAVPAANAAATYTPDLVKADQALNAPAALFDGKVITLTEDSGYHLFATDRSTDTTVQLDSTLDDDGRYEIYDYTYGLSAYFTSTQFDGKFWLWAYDTDEDNYDLMYSDGTVDGTGVVEVDGSDYWENELIGTTDGIYFWNQDSGAEDLYFFDGTTATAMNVTDGDNNSYPFNIRVFQDTVSFLVYNDSDEEVWQFTAENGTEDSVGEVVGMWNGCFWEDDLYYEAQNDTDAYAVTGNGCDEEGELWWTDAPDALYTSLGHEVAGTDGVFFDGGWYFEGDRDDNNYYGLAKAVGDTITATHEVTYPEGFKVVGDYMYFAAYNDTNYTHWNLYKMGTDGVIHTVVEDWNGSYDWAVGAGVNGSFFFSNVDDTNGEELWVDDADGTRLVKDIQDGDASSTPYYFSTVGDEVCFGAYTFASDNNYGLYCVGDADALAETGVDAGGIGTVGVLTLLVGGGLAIVRRRTAMTK